MRRWRSDGAPTDLRSQHRREQRRLFIIAVAFLLVVGGWSIAFSYGTSAAVAGAVCLAAGGGVLFLLWLVLQVIEHLSR